MTYQERIAAPAQYEQARFTARDYWALAEAGAFERYVRSELIEGEIWVVNSVHSWHARMMSMVHIELFRAVERAGLALDLYLPVSVAMSDDSVPEPDISLADENRDGPLPLAKLKLAVEITDTSEELDLRRKPHLYARHGVPEYWVVHRASASVIRHARPREDGYADVQSFAFGSPVEAATLPGLTVDTSRFER